MRAWMIQGVCEGNTGSTWLLNECIVLCIIDASAFWLFYNSMVDVGR